MPAIQVTGLTKKFGRDRAVCDLNVTVDEGELICLLGPSGSGKTTTLRCVAGLESPDEGQIAIGTRTVTDTARRINLPPAKRNIGMVFQSYAIWPHLSVFDNVAYPLKRRRVSRAQRKERIEAALNAVGMRRFAGRRATDLSGGQQQRVALARAMVADPDVLLFDEPLSNLDARLRQTVRQEIRRTHDSLGTASIYVTHDQVEALALADRVVVMSEGRIVQDDVPERLFAAPVNRFVAEFVGVDNVLEGSVDGHAGDRVTVDTPGLGRLVCSAPAADHPAGQAVDIAVRATDIRPCTAEGATAGENRLTGIVDDLTFLGESTELVVELGTSSLLVRVPHRETLDIDLATGRSVDLAVPAGAVHLMNRDNEAGDNDDVETTTAATARPSPVG